MTAATVPDLTGLGNGAEAPEDKEEVLHGGGGGGGLHMAPPAAVPQSTSFCSGWRTRHYVHPAPLGLTLRPHGHGLGLQWHH